MQKSTPFLHFQPLSTFQFSDTIKVPVFGTIFLLENQVGVVSDLLTTPRTWPEKAFRRFSATGWSVADLSNCVVTRGKAVGSSVALGVSQLVSQQHWTFCHCVFSCLNFLATNPPNNHGSRFPNKNGCFVCSVDCMLLPGALRATLGAQWHLGREQCSPSPTNRN